MISCKICSYRGLPAREFRANEQVISCPKCGIIIKRAHTQPKQEVL